MLRSLVLTMAPSAGAIPGAPVAGVRVLPFFVEVAEEGFLELGIELEFGGDFAPRVLPQDEAGESGRAVVELGAMVDAGAADVAREDRVEIGGQFLGRVDLFEQLYRVGRRLELQAEGDQLVDRVVQLEKPLVGAAGVAAVGRDLAALVWVLAGVEHLTQFGELLLGPVEVGGAVDVPLGLLEELTGAVGFAAAFLLVDEQLL